MDKSMIQKAVNASFDSALSKIQPRISRELYPAAFADENSWLHVKAVFDLQSQAIREAVTASLVKLLAD